MPQCKNFKFLCVMIAVSEPTKSMNAEKTEYAVCSFNIFAQLHKNIGIPSAQSIISSVDDATRRAELGFFKTSFTCVLNTSKATDTMSETMLKKAP